MSAYGYDVLALKYPARIIAKNDLCIVSVDIFGKISAKPLHIGSSSFCGMCITCNDMCKAVIKHEIRNKLGTAAERAEDASLIKLKYIPFSEPTDKGS